MDFFLLFTVHFPSSLFLPFSFFVVLSNNGNYEFVEAATLGRCLFSLFESIEDNAIRSHSLSQSCSLCFLVFFCIRTSATMPERIEKLIKIPFCSIQFIYISSFFLCLKNETQKKKKTENKIISSCSMCSLIHNQVMHKAQKSKRKKIWKKSTHLQMKWEGQTRGEKKGNSNIWNDKNLRRHLKEMEWNKS